MKLFFNVFPCVEARIIRTEWNPSTVYFSFFTYNTKPHCYAAPRGVYYWNNATSRKV